MDNNEDVSEKYRKLARRRVLAAEKVAAFADAFLPINQYGRREPRLTATPTENAGEISDIKLVDIPLLGDLSAALAEWKLAQEIAKDFDIPYELAFSGSVKKNKLRKNGKPE